MSARRVAAVAVAVALLLPMMWTQVSCLVAENWPSTAENWSLAVDLYKSHGLPLVMSKWVNLSFAPDTTDSTQRVMTTVIPRIFGYPFLMDDVGDLAQVRYTVDSRFCRFITRDLINGKFVERLASPYSAWRPILKRFDSAQNREVVELGPMREVDTSGDARLAEPVIVPSTKTSFATSGFRMYYNYVSDFGPFDELAWIAGSLAKTSTYQECIVDVYAKTECQQEGQPGNCMCSQGFKAGRNGGGGMSCVACELGTYSSVSGGTVRPFCDECPAGFKCNKPGMTAPVPCAAGEACPKGTGRADPCMPGFVCRAGAAPQLCPQGYYCPGSNAEPRACIPLASCAAGSSEATGQGFLDDSSVTDGGRDTAFSTLNSTTALGAQTLAVDCKGGALLRFKMRARPVVSRSVELAASGEAEMAWSYDCGPPLASGVEARTPLAAPRASTPGIAEAANATFGCADGYAMTGFSVDYSGGAGVAVTKCGKVDTVPGSCRVKMADNLYAGILIIKIPLTGPNSLGSLSVHRASCKSGALRGFKVVATDEATMELTCCDLKDDSSIVADLAARLATATTQVTQCGVRHGWISPANIRAELSNTTLSPSNIEDRFVVFSERATLVLLGMTEYLSTPSVTQLQLHELLKPATKDLDERVMNAFKLAATLAAGCPSAPIWRWVPVCTSKACTFSLTQTVTHSWESGSYKDFAMSVSEDSSQSVGQALSIDKTKESGSSTTQSDTYSVSATAGFEIGFASGSVELGYSRNQEAQSYQSQSITSDTTRTMDLSLGTTRETSNNVGRSHNVILGAILGRTENAWLYTKLLNMLFLTAPVLATRAPTVTSDRAKGLIKAVSDFLATVRRIATVELTRRLRTLAELRGKILTITRRCSLTYARRCSIAMLTLDALPLVASRPLLDRDCSRAASRSPLLARRCSLDAHRCSPLQTRQARGTSGWLTALTRAATARCRQNRRARRRAG
jgi:hypothetical protein